MLGDLDIKNTKEGGCSMHNREKKCCAFRALDTRNMEEGGATHNKPQKMLHA
jgi:hypothetical protein